MNPGRILYLVLINCPRGEPLRELRRSVDFLFVNFIAIITLSANSINIMVLYFTFVNQRSEKKEVVERKYD